MKHFRVLAGSAVAILAAAWALAQQAEVLGPQPPFLEFFVPDTAVPHVATMVKQRGWGPPGDDPSTITRMGTWVREDQTVAGLPSIVFSDLRSGTSFVLGIGQYKSLDIRPPQTTYVHARRRTDQRESVIGEACDVWEHTTRTNSRNDPFTLTQLDCITIDGITLWSRNSLRSARTVSLERRRPPPDYVRPPNELFNWAYWRGLSQDADTTSPGGDYEVTLESGPGEIRTVRRHLSWTYIDTVYPDGRRTVSISNRSLSLRYDSGLGNQERSLFITALADGPGLTPNPVRLDRPSERVAGELCNWFDLMPGTFDAFKHECRTPDGIPLHMFEGGRGSGHGFSARRVVRRPLSDADVEPPPFVFDWPR